MFSTFPIDFLCPECGKKVTVMFGQLKPGVRVICLFCGGVIIAGKDIQGEVDMLIAKFNRSGMQPDDE